MFTKEKKTTKKTFITMLNRDECFNKSPHFPMQIYLLNELKCEQEEKYDAS